jgi:hypothetical protein
MKKFMFLIREDLEKMKLMTAEQLELNIAAMTEWVAQLSASGNFLSGDPLDTKQVIIDRAGVQTDGPFIETKEGISGYLLMRAGTEEQAIEIAQSCPDVLSGNCSIELRSVMEQ